MLIYVQRSSFGSGSIQYTHISNIRQRRRTILLLDHHKIVLLLCLGSFSGYFHNKTHTRNLFKRHLASNNVRFAAQTAKRTWCSCFTCCISTLSVLRYREIRQWQCVGTLLKLSRMPCTVLSNVNSNPVLTTWVRMVCIVQLHSRSVFNDYLGKMVADNCSWKVVSLNQLRISNSSIVLTVYCRFEHNRCKKIESRLCILTASLLYIIKRKKEDISNKHLTILILFKDKWSQCSSLRDKLLLISCFTNWWCKQFSSQLQKYLTKHVHITLITNSTETAKCHLLVISVRISTSELKGYKFSCVAGLASADVAILWWNRCVWTCSFGVYALSSQQEGLGLESLMDQWPFCIEKLHILLFLLSIETKNK